MDSTPTIGKLAEALSKAQGEMASAVKDSTNPHFKNSYADITSVIEAIREPLSKHGLAYMQIPSKTDGGMILITKLMHTSGEWISGDIPLLITKNDMQGLGSSLTYARRYALSAMFGIGQEDDDGNSAKARPDSGPRKVIAPTPLPQWFMDDIKMGIIAEHSKQAGFGQKSICTWLTSNFGREFKEIADLKTLSDSEYGTVIKGLEKLINTRTGE